MGRGSVSETMPPRVIVIGCGNALRGDDAVGPEVIRRLQGGAIPAGITCIDAGTAGIDVVLAAAGVDWLIVVDSVNDIVTIEPAALQPPPDLGGGSSRHLSGLIAVDDRMVMVLDLRCMAIDGDALLADAA